LHNIRHLEAAETALIPCRQNKTFCHDGTFCRLAVSVRNALLQTQQSDSFEIIHNTPENFNESYGSGARATKASLHNVDARLKEIQKQLQQSINQAHVAKREKLPKLPLKTFNRKVPFAARRLELFGFGSGRVRQTSDLVVLVPLRLVKPGILLQERNGD
jgi:hypothetical protein